MNFKVVKIIPRLILSVLFCLVIYIVHDFRKIPGAPDVSIHLGSAVRNNAWDVKHLNINEVLRDNKNNSYKFTLFDTNTVVFRTKQELAELHAATGLDVKELVSILPERLLLHEIIVQVITKVRWETSDEMRAMVKSTYDKILHLNSTKIILAKIKQYRAGLSNNPPSNYIDIDIKKDYIPGKYINGYTMQDVMQAIVVDQEYKKYANNLVNNLITSYFSKLFSQHPKYVIKTDKGEKPYTVMLAGGPASGKSTFGRAVKSKFKQHNLDWSNVIKVDTDSFKMLLLNHGFNKYDLYLTQLVLSEAEMIGNNRLKNRIGDLMVKDKINNVFWDQVLIDPVSVNWGLQNEGHVDIFVVNTDIITALDRAHHRGQHTGRFESSHLILGLHKQVVNQLPKVISSFVDKDIKITLLDNSKFTNPINNDINTAKVLEINNAKREIYLYDIKKFQEFINKLNINVEAHNKNEVFSKQNIISIDRYLNAFYENGYTVTV